MRQECCFREKAVFVPRFGHGVHGVDINDKDSDILNGLDLLETKCPGVVNYDYIYISSAKNFMY